MTAFVVVLLLTTVMWATPAFALKLMWDPVTTALDGTPLASGTEVVDYRLYRCNGNSCSLANGTLFAIVPAPETELDVTGMSDITPYTYFVTATNVVGESGESNTVRLVPPALPKNHKSVQ